jgi:hypothetical protein
MKHEIRQVGQHIMVVSPNCTVTLKTHLLCLRWKVRKERKFLDLIISEGWPADYIEWQRGEYQKDKDELSCFLQTCANLSKPCQKRRQRDPSRSGQSNIG